MKNKYLLLKKDYEPYIVLIKSGIFYTTFDNDALILNGIFNYVIKNGKVGFPTRIIDNVIDDLNSLEMNYIILNDENDIIKKEFNNNKYFEYYKGIKDKEYNKSKKDILFNRIEFLLDYDKNNYEKIRCFLDEL